MSSAPPVPAQPRVRIEAETDVAASLALLRQARAVHAATQIGPEAVPGVWEDIRRQHWAHAQRRWLQDPTRDDRDFVKFLTRVLGPEDLEFALFVVFRPFRARMRDEASPELQRRYQAFGRNAGKSADWLAFALGEAVLFNVPSLKYLNSLLNPRQGRAFLPDEVFSAVRAAMLQRHRLVHQAPEPIPADVAAVYRGELPRGYHPTPQVMC